MTSGRPNRPTSNVPGGERRGLLDTFLAPRPPVDSPMPNLRSSLARGVVTALSTPALVVVVPLVLVAEWLGLVATGFQGPFAILVNAFAMPPIGTLTDVSITGGLFPSGLGSLIGIAVAIALRTLLLAFVTAAAVQTIRTGAATRWVVAPAIRALPVALAVNVLSVLLLFTQSVLGSLFGGAIGALGLIVLFGGMVLGVSYLGFATPIAAAEQRRLADALGRSFRAARMPGSGNLTLAVLYVVPSFAVLVAPGKPGGLIGVNPSIGAWVLAIGVNLLHVAITATYVFRYLSVAEVVPDASERRRPAARAR